MQTNLKKLRDWSESAKAKQDSLAPGAERDLYLTIYMVGHYASKAIEDAYHKGYIDALNRGWQGERKSD